MENAENVSAAALHGGRTQGEREAALRLQDRADARCSSPPTSPLAVWAPRAWRAAVNLDLPRNFEDYVRRIGRTGRAGMTGRSTSFYTDRDSFIVAQIKRALMELEAGNMFAFATHEAAYRSARKPKPGAKVAPTNLPSWRPKAESPSPSTTSSST